MTRWLNGRESDSTPTAKEGRILFLDRDGVVIVDKDYLADPGQVELVPGAAAAMARARAAGYGLVGLSNQSGIGRGYFDEAQLVAVMTRLDELLRREGAAFDAFFYCPHAPGDRCGCRKPATGLLDEAAAVLAWRPSKCWFVGDKRSDLEMARAAGLGAALVRTGYGAGTEASLAASDAPLVADDLSAVVDAILGGACP